MGYSTVVSHFGLPVEELIEALKDTESEELIEFREWLKEQSEDCVPNILSLNLNSPDLVGWQYYSTQNLEEENGGFDTERWREYRLDYDGDTVQFGYDFIMNDANDLMNSCMNEDEEYDDYEDTDEYLESDDEEENDEDAELEKKMEIMTPEKEASLGKTMTVKEACDLMWNQIRIQGEEKIFVCRALPLFFGGYACGFVDRPDDELDMDLNELLNKTITLASSYYKDEYGNPVVDAYLTNKK